MELTDLEEPYVDELKDLYKAENQPLEPLPKMTEAASAPVAGVVVNGRYELVEWE